MRAYYPKVTQRSAALLVLCGPALLASAIEVRSARADSLSSSVFVRTDSDHTLVVSPHAHLNKRLGDSDQLDVTYAADVWTSASVDVRASASLPVTEQRDELDLALTHEWQDLSLAGSYRYSVENDYVSHGVSATGSLDLAQNNTTFALGGFAFFDKVGRSGHPTFSRDLLTAGARASITQILDARMFAQLTYELAYLSGYQASPYRFVGTGGTGFGCQDATTCLAEHEPDQRYRHALAGLVRRALTDDLSIGLNYRFYLDSWQLSSHTVSAQLAWMLASHTQLALSYRFYTQTGVYFYQRVYTVGSAPDRYTTRDREQSPMQSQRLGLEWEQQFAIGHTGTRLVWFTSLGGVLYDYQSFVGLREVKALEFTFALRLEH